MQASYAVNTIKTAYLELIVVNASLPQFTQSYKHHVARALQRQMPCSFSVVVSHYLLFTQSNKHPSARALHRQCPEAFLIM